MKNRYIKIEGHENWFLVIEPDTKLPHDFSNTMQKKLTRIVFDNYMKNKEMDYVHRAIWATTEQIDYIQMANKYGTIIMRPIGSWMVLDDKKIVNEKFDFHFPIDEFGEIVICENSGEAETNWINYLINRFPDKKIVTINFFDLKSEKIIKEYFEKATYITFSTTFSSFDWFIKLSNNTTKKHKIIGYSHDFNKWDDALKINSNIEIVNNI